MKICFKIFPYCFGEKGTAFIDERKGNYHYEKNNPRLGWFSPGLQKADIGLTSRKEYLD